MENEARTAGVGATRGQVIDRRGLLDIKVTLSNPSPVAGSQFTVNLLVTNLFDVPIWPESPQVFLPSELQTIVPARNATMAQPLEVLMRRAAAGELLPRPDLTAVPPNWLQRNIPSIFKYEPPKTRIEDVLKDLAQQAQHLSKTLEDLEKARAEMLKEISKPTSIGTLTEQIQSSRTDSKMRDLTDKMAANRTESAQLLSRLNALRDDIVILSGSSAVIAGGNLVLQNFSFSENLYVRADGNVLLDSPLKTRVVTLDSSLRAGDPLQPGNTAVYSLALQTQSTLLFKPIQYSLQHSLNFSFDKARTTVHTNTANQLLTVRAPIWAVMWGSVIGGLSGFTARAFQEACKLSGGKMSGFQQPVWYYLLFAVLTAILSAIAIVFLARKSETQSMVSVEDFWGGLVVGFLVGYTGTAAFESLANIKPAGAPATP